MTLLIMSFFANKNNKTPVQRAVTRAIAAVGIGNIRSGEDVEKIIGMINQSVNKIENKEMNSPPRLR